MLNKYIDSKKDEMIQKLKELINIPSVYEKSDDQNMPFGKNANSALEYILNLGDSLGFKTKNVDGYCGYIEFGKGSELVGIIGHLDVVPANDNWTYSPFNATIHDNKIYGRGSIDDKGPVIASLYAMKAVMDNCQINKRVRLILGLDEERSWKCINYYKEHEEIPSIGFSPDADFPCIYAEKAILTTYLSTEYKPNVESNIYIKEIDCNNNPDNVVPKICTILLSITDNIDMSQLISNLKDIISKYNFNINYEIIDDNNLKIASHGKEAHSAHPDLGINAISRLIVTINDLLKHYNNNIDLFEFFCKFINTQYDGKNLGINYKDESGTLTLNVGNFFYNNNRITIGINMRIPINTTIDTIENAYLDKLSSYINIRYEKKDSKKDIYVNKNSYLVRTLCNIFNEMNNSNFEPIAIGGATYARAFDNCISFGANIPGQKDICHQSDEFITIDNLVFASKTYAKAIYELSK